jgi:sortase B
MKKSTRRLFNIILFLILAFALFQFIRSEVENSRSQKDYTLAIQIAEGHSGEEIDTGAVLPPDPLTESPEEPSVSEPTASKEEQMPSVPVDPVIEELLAIDLDALRHENEDVIGWIHIPDTKISYPLLQWTDNDFYLEHTWTQKNNASGSIFMEYQNASVFTDFNTIIYGHNMRNGSMFGTLNLYRNPKYLEAHPYIYIVNDEGVLRYDIFAVQSASTKSIIYGLGIENDRRKEEFIRFARDYSLVETEIVPTAEDRILTLSTCTGRGHTTRWVVQSVWNEVYSYKRPQ